MRFARLLTLLLCVLVFCGCQQQQMPVSAETILQPDKGGDFRGIHIGDAPRSIKREEEASSVYSMPDELIYRFNAQEVDSTWYEISYNFNQDGLNHISLDVFPTGLELKEHLYSDFVTYYNQRYGECKTFADRAEWRGLTMQGKFISVTLIKERALSDRQHLRLVFNETNQ
ncbi:MAG: hypothetical protein ACKOZM_00755 [Flavobacteriales bacterium]